MGIKASTTCELTFGETSRRKGWLLGEVHDGIAQMFQVIEHARMMVGTKAMATLSTGYLNALEYAKTRVQGADLTRSADKTAPRVTITHHPDVRRSLLTQKSYAEALRALVIYTATFQDAIASPGPRARATRAAEAVNDLLLPIVKGYGSERAWVVLGTESLQTFGGSGFLRGLPDRAVRPRLQDRHALRRHHGDPGHGLLLPQDRAQQGPGARRASPARSPPSSRPRPATAASRTSAAARQGSRGRAGDRRPADRTLMSSDPRAEGGESGQHLQGRPQHDPAADGARRRGVRLSAAPPGRVALAALSGEVSAKDRPSTKGRSRRHSSSPATCSRRSPPSAPSPRRPT